MRYLPQVVFFLNSFLIFSFSFLIFSFSFIQFPYILHSVSLVKAEILTGFARSVALRAATGAELDTGAGILGIAVLILRPTFVYSL
jgi:hypothetical protein